MRARRQRRTPSGESGVGWTLQADSGTRLRLSTRATPVVRLIPFFVLASSLSGVVAAAFAGQLLAAALVGLGAVALTVFLMFVVGALWDVWLEDNRLLASRFTQRKEIPLSEIKQVDLRRIGDDHRIRITLNDFSSHGRRLVFMPQGFKQRSGKPQEIAALLRERAGLDDGGRSK